MQEYSQQFAREYLSELRWEPGLTESTYLFSSCLPSYPFASSLPLFILFSFYIYLLSSSSLVFRLHAYSFSLFCFLIVISPFFPSLFFSSILFQSFFSPFSGLSSLCLSFPPSTFCFLFSSSLCLLCLPHIPYFTFQLHSHLSLFTLRYFPFPSLSLYLSYPYLISLLSSHLLCAFPFAFLPSLLFLFRLLNIQPIHVQLDCNGKCCFS